ncbi:MAG: hypothetical protein WCA63_03770 [Gallionella sp.]
MWLIKGTPQGRQTGVAFFLVTFSLAKQEKVTSCRSTTGGFAFNFCKHHRAPAVSRRPLDRLRANGLMIPPGEVDLFNTMQNNQQQSPVELTK